MIQVQDLCIGNWVYDGDGTQFPMWVQAIGDDYVYLNFEGNEGDLWESKPEDLMGIPLTDELLEKAGFEKVDKGVWNRMDCFESIISCVSCITQRGFVSIECFHRNDYVSRCTCLNIHYFHELQNLARCVTKTNQKFNLH